ncbi:MAG: hypothetical protein IJC36_00575 [Clostridia bacterium]|nr:hypothetical protein [Clostridia bacterium]
MFVIIKENACPCAYCEYFKIIEYEQSNVTVQNGFCLKRKDFRELCDNLCEKFVLKKGVHTQKWYPQKDNG